MSPALYVKSYKYDVLKITNINLIRQWCYTAFLAQNLTISVLSIEITYIEIRLNNWYIGRLVQFVREYLPVNVDEPWVLLQLHGVFFEA